MQLEIYTHDKNLLFDILGRTFDSREKSVVIPGNATLTYKGTTIHLAEGLPEIINFVVMFGGSVAANVVANWFYDKFINRVEKIVINRKEVHLNKDEITRVLEETIKIER